MVDLDNSWNGLVDFLYNRDKERKIDLANEI
jgi:hypothetical protein